MKEIEIYKTKEGNTQIEVKFEEDTVWLSQKQMAELFQNTIPNINLHLKNIYKEKELSPKSTIKESLIVQNEGGRSVSRKIEVYNLDVIISVGYRVKSKQGTHPDSYRDRQWATQPILMNSAA